MVKRSIEFRDGGKNVPFVQNVAANVQWNEKINATWQTSCYNLLF